MKVELRYIESDCPQTTDDEISLIIDGVTKQEFSVQVASSREYLCNEYAFGSDGIMTWCKTNKVVRSRKEAEQWLRERAAF